MMKQITFLSLVLFQWGCGSNLTNSYVDQQRNRETDMSQQQYSEYTKVVGSFTGSGGNFEKIDLILRVTDKVPDGFLVAQPRITGTFTGTPKVIADEGYTAGGTLDTRPFRDGIYNATTRKITGVAPGLNGLAADVNCTFRDDTFNQLDCKWIPSQSKNYFEFSLTRT